jgi:L-alanine-DL-glutamate epimerase-like enolase superfamily enzyme
MPHRIHVVSAVADFEREKLIRPFGLKGGVMSELWQTAVSLKSASEHQKIGLSTQSVLYGDAAIFAAYPETEANALMYLLTARCLEIVRSTPFTTPIELLENVLPEATAAAAAICRSTDVHPNFVLNALIAVDHAAWLLYAAEHGLQHFEEMIPPPYRSVLASRQQRLAIMYQVAYGVPPTEIQQAVKEGYYIIKIKLGQAGSEAEMLQKDMQRLSEIHAALQDMRTEQTADGKLRYTLDANGRYARKESVQKLIAHADRIGMLGQVLLFEEPLQEHNEAFVGDLGIRIAADESLHNEAYALKRLEQGYGAFVLKSIAKTLSLTLKLAKIAAERALPCLCADLTVNPILLSWHQKLAALLPAVPGMEATGLIETNGRENYRNWQQMLAFHPYGGASWLKPQQGSFILDESFYRHSGGIFAASPHYEKLLTPTYE